MTWEVTEVEGRPRCIADAAVTREGEAGERRVDESVKDARPPRRTRLAWLPLPLLVIVAGLLYWTGPGGTAESPVILTTLNALFCSATSLALAYLAAQTYLQNAERAMLALGSAAVAVGVIYLLSGPLVAQSLDAALVLHNGGLLAAAALFVVSAVWIMKDGPLRSGAPGDRRLVGLSYAGVLALLGLLTAAAFSGGAPAFFVAGEGVTVVRQVVLASAVAGFAIAALLLRLSYRKTHARFLDWYSVGLAMYAAGLGAVLLGESGSSVNWLGRGAQYAGGVYMLLAILAAVRETGAWRITLSRALRESEARYQSLVDLSPEAIMVVCGGMCVFANPAAMRLVAARSSREIVGREAIELFHPDHRDGMARWFAQADGGPVVKAQESRLLRRDGDAVVVEVTGGAVEHAGRPARQLIVRDITLRKRAEKALRESEARFRLALHNAPVSVAAQDRDLRYIWAYNQRTMRPEEIVGKLDSEIFTAEEAERLTAIKRRVLEEGIEITEQMWIDRPGGRIFLEVSFEPIRDQAGGVVGVGSATVDMTAMKLTEQALRQSSQDLDRAQSVGQVGSWRLDVRSNVLAWSDETYRICGMARGTPMTYERFLEVVHPDDREHLERSWRAALGGEPYDIEHRLLVDGEVTWVREKAFLEYDGAGELSGGFGIVQDVTDRKRAEEELKALYESQRDVALTLQRSFLHGLPRFADMDVALVEVPASEPDLVGGDLWDLFELSDGRIVAVIGDVAGKGVLAAGLASTVRSAIHASALVNADPGFVLGNVNRLLLDHHAEDEQFVTALVAVVDRENGELTMASAGHPGPVHLGAELCTMPEPLYGPPLGAFAADYVSSTQSLAGGDYLVLFTDGLSEARRDGEVFGDERLIATVRDLYGKTTEDLAATVKGAAEEFAGQLRDDLDVMVLRLR